VSNRRRSRISAADADVVPAAELAAEILRLYPDKDAMIRLAEDWTDRPVVLGAALVLVAAERAADRDDGADRLHRAALLLAATRR
jgi:hypothetical protein